MSINGFTKDDIINFIVRKTPKYNLEQVMEMLSRTVEVMDGMVNEDGAAYVLMNNLGIDIRTDPYSKLRNYDKEEVKGMAEWLDYFVKRGMLFDKDLLDACTKASEILIQVVELIDQ